MSDERERFYSRLCTVPGLRPIPSSASWILVEVADPVELAQRVNRRLAGEVLRVPLVPGAVRVAVRDPKSNEAVVQVLRELCVGRAAALEDLEEEAAPVDAC